jgi:hypothetical protein
MLKVATTFYQKLYNAKKTSSTAQRKLISLLPTTDFSSSLGSVTTAEVVKIIGKWTTNTVPDPDEIPLEFFKEFLKVDINGHYLRDALAVILTILIQPNKFDVSIPDSWTEDCIKILHKKEETTDIKNYRPLSMTNTIYKLFTKLIMKRIIDPLRECIERHQTEFMPDRSIFDNIKKAQTLIDRADQLKQPLYVASLDQEKVYDQVNHNYL